MQLSYHIMSQFVNIGILYIILHAASDRLKNGGIIVINYLLICRSITYAQRTVRALHGAGINAAVVRLPKALAIDGCGYCVRVKGNEIHNAIAAVRNAGLPPVRIFTRNEYGAYSEVAL